MAQMASGLAAIVELASYAFTRFPPISLSITVAFLLRFGNRGLPAGVRRSLRRPGRWQPTGHRGTAGFGRSHRPGHRGLAAHQPAGGFPPPSIAEECRPGDRRAAWDR